MSPDVPLVDFAPAWRLGALALVIALLPLSWWWLRQRGGEDPQSRRRRAAALTALTMFLTFDLVVFGSFTRLTDSGLGCPDWPGCYGQASPFGAVGDIRAAEAAMPTGPVTFTKAWIEMIHRYLAMTVGVLILAMAAVTWFERRRGTGLPLSPRWPIVALVWVVIQGLFGKYTVTLKLYPAVVTLHLIGGLVLLVLLAAQHAAYRPQPLAVGPSVAWRLWMASALLGVQIALGGWVSSNYAVLACSDFPQCNGHWWPPMAFEEGFSVLRPLGHAAGGGLLPMEALIAIHMAHRLFAIAATVALLSLAWSMWTTKPGADSPGRAVVGLRRTACLLAMLTLAQVGTGLGNVVLGWPLAAALLHSAGAASLVLLLTLSSARVLQARRGGPVPITSPARGPSEAPTGAA